MKQIFILLIVAMCATMFTACSKDDDDDDDDVIPKNKEGVITMVTEDHRPDFHIGTFNEGDIITIDWGDGTVEEFKAAKNIIDDDERYGISIGHVEHSYSSSRQHIITIKGKIRELDCGDYCSIISLDVSKCPALTELCCDLNELTYLDVSKNTALTCLVCCENKLTYLDVSKNTALTFLQCRENELTYLDVSNTALTFLDCSANNLAASALNQIFKDLPQGKIYTDEDGYKSQSTIYIDGNSVYDTCDRSIAEKKGWIVSKNW